MTYFEKLELEHPEFIGEEYPGGFALCPTDLGYENNKECPFVTGMEKQLPVSDCNACWHREMG